MDNIMQIVRTINNGFNNLGRKIDSLAMELRNKRTPNSNMNIGIPENVSDGISSAIERSLSKVKIDTPIINIPEQKAPVVNVPAPIVNVPKVEIPAPIVNVPPANITVTPTEVNFPNEMKVIGMSELLKSVSRETTGNIFDGVSSKTPLPIMVVDKKGRHIEDFSSDLTAPSIVGLRVGTTTVDSTNPLPVTTDGFAIPMFDQQIIDESLAPATTVITYKLGGVTVATKTVIKDGTTTTITVTLA